MTYPDKMQALIEVAQDLATAIAKNYAGIPDLILNLGNDLNNALADYRTRTGIDVADVVAKLSAGTHVVVPVEPTWEMQIVGRDTFNETLESYDSSTDDAAAVYRAMIAAAQGK